MRKLNFLLAAVLTVGAAASAQPQETAVPFGGPADVAFALELWEALQEARLVGRAAIESRPYEGVEPHGVILTTLQSTLTIDGHEGAIIVKNNYLGKSVSVTSVADNPRLNLGAITVMYRRETGYDPETRNWFWAKFNNRTVCTAHGRSVTTRRIAPTAAPHSAKTRPPPEPDGSSARPPTGKWPGCAAGSLSIWAWTRRWCGYSGSS